ncbi:MAG: hypothetical protein ABL925_09815 [Methylococcales bacterium]
MTISYFTSKVKAYRVLLIAYTVLAVGCSTENKLTSSQTEPIATSQQELQLGRQASDLMRSPAVSLQMNGSLMQTEPARIQIESVVIQGPLSTQPISGQ